MDTTHAHVFARTPLAPSAHRYACPCGAAALVVTPAIPRLLPPVLQGSTPGSEPQLVVQLLAHLQPMKELCHAD